MDDASALRPAERDALAGRYLDRIRESGAARRIARTLLGVTPVAEPDAWADLLPGPHGDVRWPAGLVGSLAHDGRHAVAALGTRRRYRAIGVDVEPAEPLPDDTEALVGGAGERLGLREAGPLAGRVLFALKEAAFKALHPLDRRFREFDDIEVDRCGGVARARAGNARLAIRYRVVRGAVVALACCPE